MPTGATTEATAEQRQKMADIHDKMAACLRSDRPISDCHKEMMKACKSTAGKDGCPMMDEKMHGKRHHHMMEEGGDKKDQDNEDCSILKFRLIHF